MLKIFLLGVDLGIVIGAFIYLYSFWMLDREEEAMRFIKQRVRLATTRRVEPRPLSGRSPKDSVLKPVKNIPDVGCDDRGI